ncbi:MAG: FAD-dependent oxidoreductase [Candidatus Pacebacteria bacterium]|nr:FAD-dependent oxidoreductase [Candidatus Paceibacterota bacterium]
MKTAIVGGGINGLYLAWKLAERGNEVSVFERKKEIGKRECSGFFSNRIFNFIPSCRRLVQNEINSALIHFPKKSVRVDFSRKFFLMSHFELDKLVADLAEKAGARIFLGSEITAIPSGFDRIIGCDGPNSFVRESLGIKKPEFRIAIQGTIPVQNKSDFVETWASPSGFIWKIPRGNETEYGIMGNLKEAKEILEKFLKEREVKLENIGAGLVPLGLRVSFNPQIALCGDAAGLCKPWSGGGVIWGLTAADLLLKSFPDFVEYMNVAKRFFLPRIFLSQLATKTVYFLGNNLPFLLPKRVRIESDFLL